MNRLFLLFALLPLFASAQEKIQLKDGDLIFQDMDCGPLCDAIEAVTQGYKGNNFSHMGMVFHRNDTIYIVEAAGKSVRVSTLENFSKNTQKPMFVGRLQKKYAKLIPTALNFAIMQVGTPYDDEYVYDNGSYYCSELIYDAFKNANRGNPFFELAPMTYVKPGTEEFFPAWVEYYASIGKVIPEGEPGCNPGGMSMSDKIEIVGTLQ